MVKQKDLQKIRKVEGRVRGAVFKTDLRYIKAKKGKEGEEAVKKEAKEIDPDFDLDKIKNVEWYPLKWRPLILLIIKEKFKWGKKEFYDMGRTAPSNSFIAKILLRYFYDFEKTCHEAPSYWGKHYDRGVLELVEFNHKKKTVTYRLKNFDLHPVMCSYLTGYFQGIADLTKRDEKTETRETECVFDGGSYHEFVTSWK